MGIEINPLSDEEKLNPVANWVALTETEKRPALILGTSSDRIGTPTGQSFYVTLSKELEKLVGFQIAPYVGTAYSTYDEKMLVLAGANLRLPQDFSSTFIYDGVHSHLLLGYSYKMHTLSLVLVQMEHPGVSYSISF